jgi:hypothetical protein
MIPPSPFLRRLTVICNLLRAPTELTLEAVRS